MPKCLRLRQVLALVVITSVILFVIAFRATFSPNGVNIVAPKWRVRTAAPERFLCVVTRVRNDVQNLRDFVPHYLEEGADFILILDDRSDPVVRIRHPKVQVQRNNDHNITKGYLAVQNAVERSLMGCTWVISADVDEFVTTRKNYNATVREELEGFFRNTDIIYVPWVMYGFEYDQSNKSGGIRQDMLRRWNHSHKYLSYSMKGRSRHKNIEAKQIFRPSKLNKTGGMFKNIHVVRAKKGALEIDGVTGLPKRGKRSYFTNFGEKDIANAHLVVNHYRFHDLQKIINKCLQPQRAGHLQLVEELGVLNRSLPWDHPKNVGACVWILNTSNHRDIFDDSLARKAAFRGSGSWSASQYVDISPPVAGVP